MANLASLPQELISNILLRLPTKSIGQLRCVSKPFCSHLSDPQFIKTHLTVHGPEKLIFVFRSFVLTLTFTSDSNSNNDAVAKQIIFPQIQERWENVVGSCNGLVLVLNERHNVFLTNPTTLELLQIPKLPLALHLVNSLSSYGFGYDSSSDDYKIVKLSNYDIGIGGHYAGTVVDVYSLKMRAWRRLDNSPYYHSTYGFDCGVYLVGAIHWLASFADGNVSVIATFDLASEEFKEVQAPSTLEKGDFVGSRLVVFKGCLGMVVNHFKGQADVWMMKEYGIGESWTKFTVDGLDYYDLLTPICQLGNEVVVLKNNSEFFVYNLKEGTLRDLVIANNPNIFVQKAVSFVESLVSPRFYNQIEEQHIPEDEL
ncbi:hypothetical protein ACH5RR_031087 [Cinchona calisaya]|uniref:F-box domain-containing protein n=1 Tax=Cinchona calisaya TaxID=153742 RepID=A0ABD2YIH2_9GENT